MDRSAEGGQAAVHDGPTSPASTPGSTRSDVDRVRALQTEFRRAPIGGVLLPIKKLVYWCTASAFDRQSKVIEALIDTVEAEAGEGREASRAGGVIVPRPARSVDVSTGGPLDHPPGRIDRATGARAEMLESERMLLYSLVFGAKPERVLEIGTFRGGSADIICAALDDNDLGRIFCVDPEPRIPEDVLQRISARATVIARPSPAAIEEAYAEAGSRFDFALIDGDHSHEGVVRDIEGCLSFLEPGCPILFHDSHYFEVRRAVDECVRRHSARLVDCGELSVMENPVRGEDDTYQGQPVVWGGLRMLRFLR